MQNRPVGLEDINPMSWEEFGKALNQLQSKILAYSQSSGTAFDIIAPILRSGGVTGLTLAIRLGVTAVLPIQLKHVPNATVPKQLLSIPSMLQDVGDSPSILICETNTDRGSVAEEAIRLIQEKYPRARLFYATLAKVYGGPDTFKGVSEYFFGIETNERFLASAAECIQKRLRPGVCIFPWENAESELAQINGEVS